MKGTFALLAASLTLASCASGALMVDRAPTATYRVSTAKLEYVAPSVAVEESSQAHLRAKMQEALISGEKAVFQPGDEITVRYKFDGHNEGSRVGRWLTAGLAGGSKTYIQAEFLNASGEVIGSVRSEGSVGVGIAGGSAKSGIDKAVKEIARYATVTFRK
jgi:hypothetical protein